MNPPLRSAEDVEAVRKGLADGAIDVIATDHAPHAQDEKNVEFDAAPFGIVGLETAVGLSWRLVQEGVLTAVELVRRMSSSPAAILRIGAGTLSIGADADITIIDQNAEWTVNSAAFRSKSKNTPFDGCKLKGKAERTIVGGTLAPEM
jgi:dihydroorotase